MEKAIFIKNKISIEKIEFPFTRIYYGNEFCEQHIPSIKKIKEIYSYCEKNDFKFTLVTPFVSEKGLIKIKKIFQSIKKEICNIELVFNDWGVYKIASNFYKFKSFTLGRLLNKQKRGPQIIHLIMKNKMIRSLGNIKGITSKEMLKHFQKSIANVPQSKKFFKENNINRVELDNLLQGIFPHQSVVKCSIYYPWNYITIKRWCEDSPYKIPCRKKCNNTVYVLDNKPIMPVKLYRKGNSIFFKKEKIPNIKYIDREVYLPEIII